MTLKLHPFKQSGDTLVEVLIAVAIISSVLTGAFLVSQKSVRAVRNSQEHSEMLQVLQGQVEALRSMASKQTDDTTGVFSTSPKYFCIDTTNPAGPERANFAGSVLPPVSTDAFNASVYNSKCLNLQGRYNVAITYDSAAKVFNLTGRWSSIGGGTSQEQLKYRIYPGSTP